MVTLTLPSDLEEILVEEARRQGTTLELLAVDYLRKSLVLALAAEKPAENATLFDFLSGYIGTVDGTTEALSENCGQRFTQGLLEKQQRGRL
jgi:hypothetical protein